MVVSILLVALGGALGSVCRWGVSRVVVSEYPLATLAVNVLGCLLIGFLSGFAVRNSLSSEMRLFLVTGFCGGFTTFSTFATEAYSYARSSDVVMAAGYVALSVFLGLIAVWLGAKLHDSIV